MQFQSRDKRSFNHYFNNLPTEVKHLLCLWVALSLIITVFVIIVKLNCSMVKNNTNRTIISWSRFSLFYSLCLFSISKYWPICLRNTEHMLLFLKSLGCCLHSKICEIYLEWIELECFHFPTFTIQHILYLLFLPLIFS